MPPSAPLPAVLPRLRPVPPRRGHRPGASPFQILQQPVRAGRPVAGQGPEPEAFKELRHAPEVVRLAGKDREPDRASMRVHDRHGPAGQATPGTPGSLSSGPPSAPAAFRCAWTAVPSTDTCSRPDPSGKALKTRPETPESVQRRNRLETLFHFPKRSGRSRHGDPVRNRTGTAPPKRRLSAEVTPGSAFLPAGTFPVRAHMASVSTVLSAFIVLPAHVACAAFPARVAGGTPSAGQIVNRP